VTSIPWNLILGSIVIVGVVALIGEGASRLLRTAGRRAGIKETTLVVIRDTSRGIWVVIAVVGVADYTHLASELSLLVVSTVGGLILSLALQATLSNVIAGLFMLNDGTLRVGDEITYSSVKGKVVRITLRTSWIATDKGTIAVVSNSNLLGGPLINQTATTRLVRRHSLEALMPPQKPQEIEAKTEAPRASDGTESTSPASGPAKADKRIPESRKKKAPAKDSGPGAS
jgi:small-conductance mechanosensitive channel